jgi:hypothetical protein
MFLKLLKRMAFHAAVVIGGSCSIILLVLRRLVTFQQGVGLAMVLGLVLGLASMFLERKGVI